MTISPQLLTIFLTAAALTAAAFYSFICHFERRYSALESRTFDPLFAAPDACADARCDEESPLDRAFYFEVSRAGQERADLN